MDTYVQSSFQTSIKEARSCFDIPGHSPLLRGTYSEGKVVGYFSNGTEGMMYEEQYCDKCLHQKYCPIWLLHMEWNYEQFTPGGKAPITDGTSHGVKRQALEAFIPTK